MTCLFRAICLFPTRCVPGLFPHTRLIVSGQLANLSSTHSGFRRISPEILTSRLSNPYRPSFPLFQVVRDNTIFTSTPADQLWEGVTGPKGSTKKRARGKRRVTRPKVDLHRGQRLGVGKAGMEWPGLNVRVMDRMNARTIKAGEVNEAYFQRLQELRTKFAVKKKRMKLAPLSRGWTGSRLGGQSIGPPTPEHPDFDTRVIEMKAVATMTATVGRYRRFSVLVATGNGRGLCGVGKAKAITLTAAIRRAKQKAAQNLVSFELKDNRTLWHIGYVREWHSNIFAKPSVEGSGLVCHRLIRTLCKIIGIKDMYAKVEGSIKNYQVITRGFLRLLSEQQTYSQLANRIGLNVVEFNADQDMYPRLLAAPAPGCAKELKDFSNIKETTSSVSETHSREDERRSILAISHPNRHRPRKPRLEKHESFLDDLVEMGDEPTVVTNIEELIAFGERDLDVLTMGGRIPVVRGKAKPSYWKNPGNIRAAELRHKFRNHDTALRQRQVYEALDKLTR